MTLSGSDWTHDVSSAASGTGYPGEMPTTSLAYPARLCSRRPVAAYAAGARATLGGVYYGGPVLPGLVPSNASAASTAAARSATPRPCRWWPWGRRRNGWARCGHVLHGDAGATPTNVGGTWQVSYTTLTAPMTVLAIGNTAGASVVMTSEAMKGADAEFGPDKVAAVVPVTKSVILVGYGFMGVRWGAPRRTGRSVRRTRRRTTYH